VLTLNPHAGDAKVTTSTYRLIYIEIVGQLPTLQACNKGEEATQRWCLLFCITGTKLQPWRFLWLVI
jgi:hypothetical protein